MAGTSGGSSSGGPGSSAGETLAGMKTQAETSFNKEASEKVSSDRTTQHTASADRKYVTVPSDGKAIPKAAKQFKKATEKKRRLSKPEPKLELTPPGMATAQITPSTKVKHIDASKIPVTSRKKTLQEQFAKALAAKKAKSNDNDQSR